MTRIRYLLAHTMVAIRFGVSPFLFTGLWLLLLVACVPVSMRQQPDTPVDFAAVEAFVGTPLPRGATKVQVAEQAGIDRLVQFRLEASPSAIDAFLEQLQLADMLQEGYSPFPSSAGTGLPWWTPSASGQVRGAEALLNGKAYEILVEEASKDVWTLYLRVYEL